MELGVDFFQARDRLCQHARHVVYTGPIDAYFNHEIGPLEYRSLRFDTDITDRDVQGCPVLNHTGPDVPYTRSHEWKFMMEATKRPESPSVVTYEYPDNWTPAKEPYYPVVDQANTAIAKRYLDMAKQVPMLTVGGRLGTYKYIDMDQAIGQAMQAFRKVVGNGAKKTTTVAVG